MQIIGDAGIKTAVTAFDDINKPVHKRITHHMVLQYHNGPGDFYQHAGVAGADGGTADAPNKVLGVLGLRVVRAKR